MANQIIGGLTGAFSTLGQGIGAGMLDQYNVNQKFGQVNQILDYLQGIEGANGQPFDRRAAAMKLLGAGGGNGDLMSLLLLKMLNPDSSLGGGKKMSISGDGTTRISEPPAYNMSGNQPLGMNDQISRQNQIEEQKILQATTRQNNNLSQNKRPKLDRLEKQLRVRKSTDPFFE